MKGKLHADYSCNNTRCMCMCKSFYGFGVFCGAVGAFFLAAGFFFGFTKLRI